MRVEGSVTAISWIPSEAIEGLPKLPFEVGVGHYDEPPPDKLSPGDLGRLRDADRFREANELRGVDRSRGRRDRRRTATTAAGWSDRRRSASGRRRSSSRGPVRGSPHRAGDLRRQRPVRPDRGRTCRLSGAAAGEGPAAVPYPLRHGVDDACVDAARGRSRRARARRRESVPAPLDLRQRGRPRGEERHRRLQDVVSGVARRQHAVGRRRVGSGRRGRRERPRARAVADAPLGRREAHRAEARRGRGTRRRRARGRTRSTSSSTASSASRSMASRSPRWGRERWSGERALLEGGVRTATLRALTPIRSW